MIHYISVGEGIVGINVFLLGHWNKFSNIILYLGVERKYKSIESLRGV